VTVPPGQRDVRSAERAWWPVMVSVVMAGSASGRAAHRAWSESRQACCLETKALLTGTTGTSVAPFWRIPADHVFGLPAVRFRVVDRDDPGRLLTPWDVPTDCDLAHRARLEVFGTIAYALPAERRAHPATPGTTWFRTGTMDGFQFLNEILSGRRRWYQPGMLGHKRGLWALKSDVAEYYALRAKARVISAGETSIAE
jgi:hypothetical protein